MDSQHFNRNKTVEELKKGNHETDEIPRLTNEQQDNEIRKDYSHDELMEITSKAVGELLKNNSILRNFNLPADVTPEEVESLIAVEHGQAMAIYLQKDDKEIVQVVVHQKGSKVIDLKQAVKKYMTMHLKRKGIRKKLSWKYIWRTYYLSHNSVKLINDSTLLSELGIKHKSTVKFVRRLIGNERRRNNFDE